MRGQLREIELYASVLTAEKGSTPGGRRAPGFRSTSPARDEVIVARDVRSKAWGDGPDDTDTRLRSILGTLHGLSTAVREEFNRPTPPEPPTIMSEVRFLTDWCGKRAELDGFDEFAQEIRELHNLVRGLSPLADPTRTRKLGPCPEDECGGVVYAETDGNKAWCTQGHEWDRRYWAWLGRRIEEAAQHYKGETR
ncbi:hypothetical protein [Amycolatopsis thermoflava]|uniref:hypothetical protein n=1 Tax=Amycolatopsis thermoflava TaxID=84480 RepID=UPI0012FA8AE8|nr:hypothetical protein [Amycolatopsis thermoflava]